MTRLLSACLIALLTLAACGAPTSSRLGSDGQPLPQVYKIRGGDTSRIQFRMLDSINSLRAAAGVQPVQLESRLTSAAATHSRDMAAQNRPWHFGSDGSSPLDRIQRAGFSGALIGEAISETYETELETLSAWMDSPGTREIILDPRATDLGFSWYQERNGKIWWTLVLGERFGGAAV